MATVGALNHWAFTLKTKKPLKHPRLNQATLKGRCMAITPSLLYESLPPEDLVMTASSTGFSGDSLHVVSVHLARAEKENAHLRATRDKVVV